MESGVGFLLNDSKLDVHLAHFRTYRLVALEKWRGLAAAQPVRKRARSPTTRLLQQSWSSDTFMEKVTEFTASLCEIDKATDLKLPAYRNVASRLVLHGITRTKDLVGLTPEEAGQIFTKIDEVALAKRVVLWVISSTVIQGIFHDIN